MTRGLPKSRVPDNVEAEKPSAAEAEEAAKAEPMKPAAGKSPAKKPERDQKRAELEEEAKAKKESRAKAAQERKANAERAKSETQAKRADKRSGKAKATVTGKSAGQTAKSKFKPRSGPPLDANQVTFKQLREFGMSVTQATRVIAYRERRGGFDSVDDLDSVPGIPETFLTELKGELTA